MVSAPERAGAAVLESAVETAAESREIVVAFAEAAPLTDFQFEGLRGVFVDWRFARGPRGELIIAPPPPATDPGPRGAPLLIAQIMMWIRALGGGTLVDASGTYAIPGTEILGAPDLSWISPAQLADLPPKREGSNYREMVPTFAIEIRSRSDSAVSQVRKASFWVEHGTAVGWMIDPWTQRVHVFRRGQAEAVHERPSELEVGPEMPGLVIDLDELWDMPDLGSAGSSR